VSAPGEITGAASAIVGAALALAVALGAAPALLRGHARGPG
jgi:hypothetical protein